MSQPADKVKSVFLTAIEKYHPDQWHAYLDGACGDDADLRLRVEELLKAHADLGTCRESDVAVQPTVNYQLPTERPGTLIGPYKLLQEIGQGGFGVVYLAQQQQPVQRKVALKIIKPGMDTREVIARFEAERQALAMMDHPHIARVLDAGATESGRPYFVMELVRGIRVTEYCDQNKLTAGERLELFVTVCRAVQHAHQKGVIHRDIKPSNVLVTLHDGRPLIKVIDFGIAKAINQRLTEKTLFTHYAQMVGTPMYMSPEQAEMSGLDVDTRTDIYSLGVLLYELLTGTTPFDKQRIHDAAYDEIRRIIRDEEPPKPSTKVSSLGDAATNISAHRKTDPHRLRTLIRGDLDWIVMKAMEKDRTRRYETANGLASDIRRYLDDEPVVACPPSAVYRFHKFARRNKTALSAAVLVAVTLLLGATASVWQAVRATRSAESARIARQEAWQARQQEAQQRRAAEQAQQTAEQEQAAAEQARQQERDRRLEAERQRERAEANFARAREAVDQFLTKVSESQLLSIPGLQTQRRALLDSALSFYQDFVKGRSTDPELQRELAAAHYRIGRIQSELGNATASRPANQQALQLYRSLIDQGHDSPSIRSGLANAYFYSGKYKQAAELCRQVLELQPDNTSVKQLLASTYNSMALSEKNTKAAEALQLHQQALELRLAVLDEKPDDPVRLGDLAGTLNNIGVMLAEQNRPLEALEMYRLASEYLERVFAKAPEQLQYGRWLAIDRRNLARTSDELGFRQQALKHYQRVADVRRKMALENPAVPDLHSELYKAYLDLANYQRTLGQNEAASRSLQIAGEVIERLPRETAEDLFQLAVVYAQLSAPSAGRQASGPADRRNNPARQAARAVETLQQALADGYSDINSILKNKNFDWLREREDFRELMAGLEREDQVNQLLADKQGSDEEQRQRCQQALETCRQLAADEPDVERHQRRLASALSQLAGLHAKGQRYADARMAYAEAIRIREALRSKHPDDSAFTVNLATLHVALGSCQWKAEQAASAHRAWQTARELLQEARDRNPTDSLLGDAIGSPAREIAQQMAAAALWQEAAQCFRLAVGTGNAYDNYSAALVFLLADNREAYSTACQLALEEFSEVDPFRVLTTVTLVPQQPADVQDLQHMVKQVESEAWRTFLAGLVLVRAQRFREALDHFNSMEQPSMWFLPAIAIAHHHSGDAKEALRLLDQSDRWYQRLMRDFLTSERPSTFPWSQSQGWYGIAYFSVFRDEAARVVQAQDGWQDPWQHLARARALAWLEQSEQAEQQFQAAVQVDRQNPAIWTARAGVFAQLQLDDRARADFQTALDLAADDPLPWIARLRYFAKRGDQPNTDADGDQAASLTPDELNKFVQAGWWVAGPYAAAIDDVCPPESDPDPSHAVPQQSTADHVVAKRLPWRFAPSGEHGRVELGALFPDSPALSAYALTYVYSPDERTTTLLFGSDGPRRLWLNGQLVHESMQKKLWIWGLDAVPVVLRPGRNVILAKVSLPTASRRFLLRIADRPVDRAWALAERGLWDEAAALFSDQCRDQLDNDAGLWGRYLHLLLAMGDSERYGREIASFFGRYGDTSNAHVGYGLSRACSLAPNPVSEKNAEQLVELSEMQLAKEPNAAFRRLNAVLANYRAGRFEEARQHYLKLPDGHFQSNAMAIMAMIEYRLGNADLAGQWLEKANQWYETNAQRILAGDFPTRGHWSDWAEFLILRREAQALVEGSEPTKGPHYDAISAQARAGWKNRDPATAAFDHAILVNGHDVRWWIARARRLAELGRRQEAEADFQIAVQRAPNDVSIRTERARFYLERDTLPEALSAADQALVWKLRGDEAQGQRDLERARDCYRQAIQLTPENAWLYVLRAIAHRELGDLDKSVEDCNHALRLDAESTAANVNSHAAYTHRAEAYLGQEEYRQALADLNQAIELKESAWSYRFRAAAQLGLGNPDDALRDCERAILLQPQGVAVYVIQADALIAKRQFREAIAACHTALAKATASNSSYAVINRHRAQLLLAVAHAQMQQPEQARQYLSESVQWLEQMTREGKPLGVARRRHMEKLRKQAEDLLGEKTRESER